MEEVVWLYDERCFAILVHRGAYYSEVYIPGSEHAEDIIEVSNDDYDFWEERAIDYEPDDGC